jgi:CheY-like chemotaxis protein
MKILLVDDSEDMIHLMTFLFESQGHIIYTAYSGNQALKSIEDSIPDLMFLDHNMEDMSGPQFLRKLYEFHPELHILTVMITGMQKDQVDPSYIDEILQKPVNVNIMLNLSDKYLGKRKTPMFKNRPGVSLNVH